MKKKLIVVLVVLAISSVVLVGCKKKTECFFCGDEALCGTIKFWGEDCYICGDCMAEWKAMFG